MDIPQLAAKIAEFLAPFLPYLILATQAAAKEAGKRFGEAAWNKAQVLWEKLKPKVEEKPLLKEATEKVARKPEDKRVIGNLEVELEEVFNDDVELAQVMNSIVIGGDVINSQIAHGNKNTQQSAGDNSVQIGRDLIINPPQPNPENEKINKARDSYLRNLITFCNLLPLTALGDEKSAADSITLENVYINLDTDTFKEDKESKVGKSRKNEMELEIEREKKNAISCMEAATKEDKLVLLGNAGSGKSSFVKHLIARQAVVLKEGKPALEGFSPDLIPVYIELRKLSPRLKDLNIDNLARHEKLKKLSDVAFEQLRQEAQERNASEFFSKIEDAFNEGNILLVLDGLDEVPQKLREIVRLTVEALIQLHKIKKIIITSRPNAYKKLFDNFSDYNIALLDEEKIEKFAEEWYNVQLLLQKVNEEEAKQKTQDLARRAVREIPNEMSGNPMMLTCIAIIHKSGRVFPKHRAVLFNEIVDILSSKWQEEKAGVITDAELAEVLKDKKLLRKALEGLAYKTHRSNYEAGGNTDEADLSYEKAYGLLLEPEYFGSGKLAGAFLDYIYQQSGLFHSHGGEQTTYRFPHRQIQEYLTGCYLIRQDNCEELYKTHAAQGDFWSASALLGAEEIIYIQDKAERILLNIIYELCPSEIPETEGEERAVLWAGQIAIKFGIDKIEQKARGKNYIKDVISHTWYLLERSRFLTAQERAEAGNTLAQLGDPRIGVIPHPHPQPLSQERERGVNLLFCEIRAGEFLMGTNEKDIKDLAKKFNVKENWFESETPQIKVNLPTYFMSRYPVTNAQFEAFVKAEDGYTQAKWWTEAGLNWRDENKRTDHYRYGGVFDLANHPVVGVTWYEAIAFCKWLTVQYQETSEEIRVYDPDTKTIQAHENLKSKIVNRKMEIRLPSEAEWEYAARGNVPLSHLGEGLGVRVFPWKSNDITPNHANYADTNLNGTSAVGAFPLGMNDFGLLDMSGNVWEWCATEWQEDYKDYLKKENNKPEGKVARVLRGGSFDDGVWYVRCARRNWYYPITVNNYLGFRVVCVSSPISP